MKSVVSRLSFYEVLAEEKPKFGIKFGFWGG
jgi:hypothetical protein